MSKRDSAGANQATIYSHALDVATTNDMVAFAPKAMTVTVANVIVPAGSVLTGRVTKSGTGIVIASATAQASIEVTLEKVI